MNRIQNVMDLIVLEKWSIDLVFGWERMCQLNKKKSNFLLLSRLLSLPSYHYRILLFGLSIYLKVISMFSLTAITLHIGTTTITLAYIIIYHFPPYWLMYLKAFYTVFISLFLYDIRSGVLLTAK